MQASSTTAWPALSCVRKESLLWKGFVKQVGFKAEVKKGVMDVESGDITEEHDVTGAGAAAGVWYKNPVMRYLIITVVQYS